MMYRLIVLNGPMKGQRVTVEQEPMTLGRDESCTLRVDDEEVASKHAVIEHRADGLFIRDLGSMNKVLVNHREMREARLKHNDVVELGRTRFLVQAVVQAEVNAVADTDLETKRFPIRMAIAVALLIMAAGFVWHRQRAEPVAEEPVNVAAVPDDPPSPQPVDAGAPPITEELRLMRQALADIRETVKGLVATQAAAAASATAVQPPPSPPLRQAAQTMEEVRRAVAQGDLDAADQMLAGLQLLEPQYLPAYEERARLYEQRGMYERAVGQWLQIIQRNPDPSWHEKAVAERNRLGQFERRKAAVGQRHVRIAGVEQHKFRASEDFEEMRILNITLAPLPSASDFDPRAVRVDVLFFDEDKKIGRVEPSRAITPKEPLSLGDLWAPHESIVVTATYAVPKSLEDAAPERSAQYYGYMVRVYYNEVLEDQDARPRTLAQRLDKDQTDEEPAQTIRPASAPDGDST